VVTTGISLFHELTDSRQNLALKEVYVAQVQSSVQENIKQKKRKKEKKRKEQEAPKLALGKVSKS